MRRSRPASSPAAAGARRRRPSRSKGAGSPRDERRGAVPPRWCARSARARLADLMRIVAVHEKTVSIASPIANAFIDFSKMTCSVVAVVTDAVRDGRRVVGYGFNSNGRYGQGALLRERFFPRLMEADPRMLLDDTGENLDPLRIWATAMRDEKPGGHGERSVAVGTLDMAVWDAVAKIAGKPLYRLLADRYRNGEADDKVWVYAAGAYYYPANDLVVLKNQLKSYPEPTHPP